MLGSWSHRLSATVTAAALVVWMPGAVAQAESTPGPQPTVIASMEMPAPTGLGFDEATGRITIAGSSDGIVRIVDPATWSLIGELPTDVPGQELVQMFPEGGRAYVLGREPLVNVIDVAAASLVEQIPMNPEDRNASGSVIAQADVPLLLASFEPGASPGAVALISTVTNFRRGTVVLPFETAGMVIPKDRLVLVVASPGSGDVLFLDSRFTPLAEVPTGGTPENVIASEDGSRIYVSNPSSGRIDVIDTDRQQLVGSIDTGLGVSEIALSPSGRKLAATIPSTGEVLDIDLTTARVVSRQTVGTELAGIAFANDDRVVYVADLAGNALLAVDLAHERPGPPRKLRLKAGDTSVRVSWAPPVAEGTSPVVRYRVTALPKAGSCVTRKRTCRIQGLKPGKSYRFQVVAESQVAQGEPAVSKPIRVPRR